MAKLRVGGHAYYLEPLGLDGRPPTEAPGRWAGRGSDTFGLQGRVTSEQLAAVLAGTDVNGAPLPGADRRRVKVTGFDLTFCAPKSVSLLQALAEPEVADTVLAGHERSVTAALAYVEERALAVRRRSAGRVPQPSDASPAAAFVHRTSRAADPHLHTHVVLANVARATDGSWSALDGRGVYAHASAAGALYQAQLRHELTATLGVAWGTPSRGRADLAGVPSDVRRAFSQRSEQIAAHLAERGLVPAGGAVSGRATRVAGLATRAPKDLEAGADQLRPVWRERATALGFGQRRLDAVLDRVPRRERAAPDVAAGDSSVVAAALTALRGPDRAFARRDVVRAYASSLPGGAPSDHVAAVVERFMVEVTAGEDRGRHVPGVGEPRVELPERLRRRELEMLLERRGMVVDRALGHDRAMELGVE